jgi:uncharacterized membrane protein YvlD (DUF360 family)
MLRLIIRRRPLRRGILLNLRGALRGFLSKNLLMSLIGTIEMGLRGILRRSLRLPLLSVFLGLFHLVLRGHVYDHQVHNFLDTGLSTETLQY